MTSLKFAQFLLKRLALSLCVFTLNLQVQAQPSRSVEQRPSSTVAQAAISTRSVGNDEGSLAAKGLAAKRMALIVGNASYVHVDPLKNAANDAEDMCAALRRLNFDVTCQYNVPGRSEFRQIVRAFTSRLTPDTVALFYYAGHGVQINGENFLLPVGVDAKVSLDMEDDSLNLNYLLRSLESARSSPNIVILDACRNNPFERTPGGSKGLARIDPPVGTVLVYATAPNDVAMDGKGRNGLFTKNLLNHISEPGRKLDELFQVVAQSVEQEAFKDYNRARQVPYRSYSFSGSFCIAGCEDPKVAAQIAQIKRESDEAEARVRALTEENTRLLQQAAERAASVSALETKIGALSKDASSAGAQSATVSTELAQLRTSLASARAAQLDAEKLKTEVTKRESEIDALRVQMAVLSGKANQLEEYRLRIDTLERENADKTRLTEQIDQVKRQSDEATKRVASLTEENAKLRQQAQDRSATVQALEVKISALSNETANYGVKSTSSTADLANLRAALEVARAAQQRADAQKDEAGVREREILELKNQIAGLQSKSTQLEDMRKRIITLETENADKTQQLNNKEAAQVGTRPVLIPSF